MEQYGVEGMACTGCEERVANAIARVAGVHHVEADHQADTVEVTAEDGTEDAVRWAIHAAGYDVPP